MAKKNKEVSLGSDLISSLREMIEFEKGEKRLRTTEAYIASPPPKWSKSAISKLRKDVIGVSQPVFASVLGVRPQTVKAWEQGLNEPSDMAKRLLEIIATNPQIAERILKKAG